MDFDKYECNSDFPQKNDYITYNVYLNGKVLGTNLNEEQFKEIKRQNPHSVVEQLKDEIKYKQDRDKYYKKVNELEQQFINDLFVEFGVENNPKREKAYQLAYSYGHSAGYQEIYNYLIDMVNLIKD
jgi:hypothetical protein